MRNVLLFAAVGMLFILTGAFQSWNLSLSILNIGILSAIMALGVNMQWGSAGLFSTGIMGSVALGGLAVVALVMTIAAAVSWGSRLQARNTEAPAGANPASTTNHK